MPSCGESPSRSRLLSRELGARFLDLCNPSNGTKTAHDLTEDPEQSDKNYALPNCFIENDRPNTAVSDTGGLLYR
jgi:hypothetical protein